MRPFFWFEYGSALVRLHHLVAFLLWPAQPELWRALFPQGLARRTIFGTNTANR
ncbi:hypothetical protein J2T57_003939 [Natronocella acetinitrilica]|uniref:Uncharacterized protein n=1 Tax=Natronocella acetinitrilica TaxID=414046 RepID=A0AAE3G8K4_9GAMM|nr:hypothetical protein [Natronocella acetinitrilica]